MSIILKGIDMPKDGKPIRLVITSSGDVVEVWRGGLEKAYHRDSAIQIPKGHGRLIDADETRTQYYQTMDELLQSTTINISAEALSLLCGLTLIHDAPTILEAEEENEI